MKRESLIYLLVVLSVGLGLYFVMEAGNQLTPTIPHPATSAAGESSLLSTVAKNLQHHAGDPLGRLFLQLLIILSASRLLGAAFQRAGQPAVVGEMTAGILLGPSLFGLLSPETFRYVFDPSSLGALKLFSQIGVCLFMFTVGMELDVAQVRNKAHTAVVVSHASIIIPFFLGAVVALFLFRELAQAGSTFTAFSLFLGISMSITAFPVLARILQERGMTKNLLGVTAITCAAVDDVTAWSILAFVVAIARATSVGAAAFNLLLVLLFVGAMLYLVKPLLPRLLGGPAALLRSEPNRNLLAIIIAVVLASSYVTELIGIHALFGAFLAGTIIPNVGNFRHQLAVRVENFSSVLLLPLFFAFTGLRTQIGLLQDARGWLLCLGIIAIATLGKLGGSAVTARLTGLPWRESLQLGALMNTRGLMELIALNIGYDMGILSPRIFAMLVIMALVTTAMTSPLLTLFQTWRRPATASDEPVTA